MIHRMLKEERQRGNQLTGSKQHDEMPEGPEVVWVDNSHDEGFKTENLYSAFLKDTAGQSRWRCRSICRISARD